MTVRSTPTLLNSVRILLVLLIVLAAGCAARAPVHEPAAEAAWLAHREVLRTLDEWQVKGRVAVRAGEEGWSAHFDWQQQGDAYRIRLRGPFGQGAVELRGDVRGVWMRQPDRPEVFASDAEALLERETGLRLPVSGLRSWLLGMPVDDIAAEYEWDAQGMLSQMDQSGWHIDYNRYQQNGSLRLPARMRLERDTLQVKFVIDTWQMS